MSTLNRVQAGIPEGGQFSETAKARPDTSGLDGLPGAVVDVEISDARQATALAQTLAKTSSTIDRVRLRGPEDVFSDAPYTFDAAFDDHGRQVEIPADDNAHIDAALADDIGLNAEKAGSWMVAGHLDDSDDMDNRPNDAIFSPRAVLEAEAVRLDQHHADERNGAQWSQMREFIRNRDSDDNYRRREELRIQITTARADELNSERQPVDGLAKGDEIQVGAGYEMWTVTNISADGQTVIAQSHGGMIRRGPLREFHRQEQDLTLATTSRLAQARAEVARHESQIEKEEFPS
ncbi:hypothetical protein GCM10009689_18560 [Brevibacterium antiquum]|uniref:hypothetical protein n=1 Tax=Brevibacterium antiquum TaxID=234835 RepID=UPI0018E029A9|nr:hypothetical protein [Brevibacterium antiquum]